MTAQSATHPLRALLPAAVVLTLLATAGVQLARPGTSLAGEPEVEIHKDVVFGRGGETELKLDLATPPAPSKPRPCVLIFHGGGWVQGDKRQFLPLARYIATKGYVAATVQYRLARPGRNNPSPWPAQIHDAKCAVRYMRANAKRWNIDPTKIAAMGFSAGAHLSMLLGTMDAEDGFEGTGGYADQSSKVNAVVGFYGPSCMGCLPPADAATLAKLPLVEKQRVMRGMALGVVLGSEFAKDPTQASPLTYVSPGDAPMLLFQGTKDTLVAPDHTRWMMEALTKAKVPGKAVFMLGLGHGWRGDPHLTNNVKDTERFLNEQFRPEAVESILADIRRR
jgi:acetyl esterase/lipase